MDLFNLYLIIALILCFAMTWGVGANDLANVMSTTMGSKAVSIRTAIIIAIVFEFAGAFLGGSGVTETLRDGIINTSDLASDPATLIRGMLSVLLACTVWMNLASYYGLPVSITNAIVGAMVGFGSLVLGPQAMHWQQVAHIAIGWVTSPLIAGTAAYGLFVSIQQTILIKKNPLSKAKIYTPFFLILVGSVLTYMTVFKGLAHFDIYPGFWTSTLIYLVSIFIITVAGLLLIKAIPEKENLRRHERFKQVEKYFGILMALTACAMVFAHGSNDVALAVGPLSIIHSLVQNPDMPFSSTNYPAWIILLGVIGVLTGLLMYGRKVIETVGSSITALTPSRAFAATLSAATTVIVATSIGIPISATQTLVGSVLGVGLARGIGALNLIVIRNIFTSWILTLPAASILTIIFYEIITYFLT